MQSYSQMVTYYAALGQPQGVWLLFLGSEMSNLQQYSDDWRQLKDSVRQNGFTGLVTYQPNWESIDGVAFWDALDLVTVSAYFPLTSTPRPSVVELKNAWHSSTVDGWRGQNWVAKLGALANATGKRVLIGEVGYRSSETATAHPWDETETQTPDQATQANAYQALLETFSAQPWWTGVIWWQWRGGDQGDNTDMSPKAKQAEQFLTQWWAEGWRPGSASAGAAGGGGGSKSGARAVGSTGRTTPGQVLGSSPTAPSSAAPTTQQGATSEQAGAAGSGEVNAAGDVAAVNGPRSVARLTGASHGRGAAAAFATVALLGMGVALVNVGLRIRTPRPLR
jgi:hypothetical protein